MFSQLGHGMTYWDYFWEIAGPVLLGLAIINILFSIYWIWKKRTSLVFISALITFCLSLIYLWSVGYYMMAVAGIQFIAFLFVKTRKTI